MEEKDRSKYLGDIEYFSKKLEEDPSSILFVPLAKAYLKLEKYDEAVQLLTTGIDANSEAYSAKTMLAKAYLGQGNIDEAKAILTEVQVVDRQNYLASKLMGDILRNEDEIKKALVCYRNALMVAPEDFELKNLVEELMSASGIAASELEADFSLMDADDDMLEQLGQELADEVRNEVGEAELGSKEASDAEVHKTVDEIVGESFEDEDAEEMSLDNFEDSSNDYSDELEEEMIASFDDDIVPMALSGGGEPVHLDAEIMKADEGEAPSDDDVRALAAELGADLGLKLGDEPAFEPKPAGEPDAVDEALAGLFDGVEDDDDVQDAEALLSELQGKPVEEVASPEDDVEAMLAMVQGEQPQPEASDDEITGLFDGVEDDGEVEDAEALLSEFQGKPVEEIASPEDDVEAMLAMVQGEQPQSESAEDEIADIFNGLEETDADEPDDDVEAMLNKLQAEEAEKTSDEEIFEASMEELLEKGPEDADDEIENTPDKLNPETREQVNKLENLLEIIKNNSARG